MNADLHFRSQLLFELFKCIPLRLRKHIFILFSIMFYYIYPRRRFIALYNLQCVYPYKNKNEVVKIIKGVYRNLGIMAAEIFEFPFITKNNIHKWVDFEGLDNFYNALGKNRGVLFVMSHFGNWEFIALACSLELQPLNIIYRPLDNRILDNLLYWIRKRNGNIPIPKKGAMKISMDYLRNNKVIGIFSDQSAIAPNGVFVDFFRRATYTDTGPAVIALKTGASVLPVFMIRMESNKYKLIVEPEVEIINTGHYEMDLCFNTQLLTKIIEKYVKRYPDQWLWVHRRWKINMPSK